MSANQRLMGTRWRDEIIARRREDGLSPVGAMMDYRPSVR